MTSRLPYPVPTSAAVSAVMRGNRKVDTKPEVELRRRLHAAGERFRKNYLIKWDGGRVRVDIVFPGRRIAVFVDGCFWHRCPDHGSAPSSNAEYWATKLARNEERDRRVTGALERAGWKVVRVWEHTSPDDAARVVLSLLGRAAHERTSLVTDELLPAPADVGFRHPRASNQAPDP